MTAFEEGLWARLVDEHDADRVTLATVPEQTHKRPLVIGGSLTTLAAISAAAVVAITSATNAPPAYALTPTGDGTYTLRINDIAAAIPALNAKFKQLGINMTVIPVKTTCTAPNDGVPLVGGWPASTLNETITLDQANIPAGSQGVLAVYQSPSGGVDLDLGSVDGSGPLPPCLNPNDVGYPEPIPSSSAGGSSTTAQ